ncbi:5-formyltetrahydrofolate cyclo-ligase [Burkholderia lata]|uniref:5-formyltetrahydrofolate cyclo-ligase n=1 Tax=Burkholderia lata (strain ATCC 17760 / DSM 23089 / LMG 22485 / NCIMB 9086 / R18194 / 383) TaxID=482957 RepID=A0A6P2LEB8_BURL3|nr:5-formyltetrahydrofolate cyclo-ligase [Burkholderia lata]
MLFEDGRYEETVDRFLVSEDGRKFVVLGKKYHYIFDMPEHLGAVLASPYRKSINAALYGFVAQGSKISGKFSLQLSRTGMTDDDWNRALEDGFTKRGSSGLEMTGVLDGSRYLADGFAQGKTRSSFAHAYKIQVTDRITTAGKAVRVLATPVTLAADGVMMIGAVALSPIIVVMIAPVAGVALGP